MSYCSAKKAPVAAYVDLLMKSESMASRLRLFVEEEVDHRPPGGQGGIRGR